MSRCPICDRPLWKCWAAGLLQGAGLALAVVAILAAIGAVIVIWNLVMV